MQNHTQLSKLFFFGFRKHQKTVFSFDFNSGNGLCKQDVKYIMLNEAEVVVSLN